MKLLDIPVTILLTEKDMWRRYFTTPASKALYSGIFTACLYQSWPVQNAA
jgi:hypothetical protein